MRILIAATSAIAILATTAMAGPIEDRIALMKSNGQQMGILAPIAKGEKDFDAAVVKTALEQLAKNAEMLDPATLFPEGSDMGAETTAAPAIWEMPDEFMAKIEKFRADTAAAVAADPQDVGTFRAQFGTVASNCGGCHQTFRVKKG